MKKTRLKRWKSTEKNVFCWPEKKVADYSRYHGIPKAARHFKWAIIMSLGGKKSVPLSLKTLTNGITGVVKVES